ncbi:MAG TPA: ABC transporter permease, partial [Rhodobacteraceae bacterium]|nr:ABC transporter permease [Paracoccaceae bacterium]
MPMNKETGRKMSLIVRILDSDIWYSFTRSKVTMIAALITFLIFASAL